MLSKNVGTSAQTVQTIDILPVPTPSPIPLETNIDIMLIIIGVLLLCFLCYMPYLLTKNTSLQKKNKNKQIKNLFFFLDHAKFFSYDGLIHSGILGYIFARIYFSPKTFFDMIRFLI
jgi:hypothetical protein